MVEYDVKAACEERQELNWPVLNAVRDSLRCICTELQAAYDAGRGDGRRLEWIEHRDRARGEDNES